MSDAGVTYGNTVSFFTPAPFPIVTTLPASAITLSNAQLSGTANPNNWPQSAFFQYGFSTAYGVTTPPLNLPATNFTFPLSAPLFNLLPGTLYHFRAAATNDSGGAAGADATFLTGVATPIATTLPATAVAARSARLNGNIAANGLLTSYYFDYGQTTNYGQSTVTNFVPPSASALNFNGVNQWAETTNSLSLSNMSFTVEGWARRAVPNSLHMLFTHGEYGVVNNTLHFGFRGNNNFFTFAFWGNDLDTPNAYTDSDWHHWAGTFDATTLERRIYRDGVLVANDTATAAYQGTNPFLLGGSPYTGTLFNGDLDEVRIWSVVRSQADIAAGMMTNATGLEPGLLACWRFDEGSGSFTADSGPNGLHAIVQSSPTWINPSQRATSLSGLLPANTEHFRAVAFNSLGINFGDDLTFTNPPDVSVATTLPTSSVGISNATLNATILLGGAPTTVYFDYGPASAGFVASTASTPFPATNDTVSLSIPITGLAPATTYQVRAVALSIATNYGTTLTFTTGPDAPTASTLPATGVTATNATVSATVSPNGRTTTCWFQYGTDTNYGSATTGKLLPSFPAMRFNGNNQYMYTANYVNLYNTSFTIEAWARHSAPNQFDLLLQHGGAVNYSSLLHFGWRASNQFTFAFFNNDLNTTNTYPDTDWHHWAGTFDATTRVRTLYRDGVPVASDVSPVVYQGAGGFTIALSSAIGSIFPGDLDDVRVWTIARSQAAIQAGMNREPDGTEANLISCWRFRQVSGNLTPDATTNANNGTLINSPIWLMQGSVTNSLAGLSPNTTYQYRVVVSNEFGVNFGTNLSFTTPLAPPGVTTVAASFITSTDAVLNAAVNPYNADATASFQFGVSTNYVASLSAGLVAATNTAQPVSLQVSCEPGTVYFFRALGTNAAGLARGTDLTFVTPAVSPVATTLDATGVAATNATLQGSATTGGRMTKYYWQYGGTTNYGSFTAANLLPPGRALRFNGANQYITTPKPINLSGASFTVEAWARRASIGSDDFFVLQGSGGVNNSSLAFGFRSNNGFTFSFWNNDLNTTSAYSDTNWHHWAGTFNASTRARTLYRDGLVITNDISPSLYSGTTAFLLAYSPAAGAYFGGDLAEARIWSGERSPSQINADMDATVLGNEPGLLAAWRLNESSGALAADATANANHGSLQFVPSWMTPSIVPTTIGGLLPLSPLNFRLVAINSVGTSYGSNLTFTTLLGPPIVTTLAASGVGPTNATFNATVNPNAASTTVYFQYGLTTNYGLTTTPGALPATNSALAFNTIVTGLSSNAIYNYRAVASNGVGIVFGSNFTFSTPLFPPVATTLPATGVSSSSATLQGSVNPSGQPTRSYFQYGLTTNYGSVTATNILPPSGTGVRFVPGQYVSTVGTLNLNSISFSVEVWARHTGSNVFELLLQHGSSAVNNAALHFGWRANNAFTFAFFNNDLNTTSTYADTDWHHWAGTFNVTNHVRTIYRDGVPVASDVPASAYLGSGGITLAVSGVNGTYYTGDMDEVRIYNYARSQAQIQAGMFSGFNTNTGGELALWHLNEGSGGSTADSSGFGHTGSLFNSPSWLTPNLAQLISGLQPASTYQFRLVATNASGTSFGTNLSFTTAPLAPSATTLLASSIDTTSAVFNATVNPGGAATTVWFQYGLTPSYGLLTTSTNLPATNGILSVSNLVAGFQPGTLYHCRVVASNSAGVNFANNRWFTTAVAPPIALTRPTDAVTTNAATLHGELKHNGSITRSYFEYGSDTNYGQFTATNMMRPIGAALRFNGTNQYVNIPSALNLANRSFTVEAWVRRASTNRLDLFFAHGSSAIANAALHLGFRANNVFTFAFWADDLDTTNTYTDTDWHHWAGTFENTTRTRTIYRDGVVVASDIAPTQYQLSSGAAYLGVSPPAGVYFGGDLDEIHVWSTALTPAQIAGVITTNALGTETNLLACWRLDEGSGNFTGDVTQNGYHGNLFGPPTWLMPSNPPLEFLTSLQPGTAYNYRLVAFNGAGFNYGSNVVFTTDGAIVPPPPQLNLPVQLADGSFQLSFTSVSGAPFSVLGTTNLALPVAQWDVLGPATETPPGSGQFQFTDPQATNLTSRFYLLRSP
jgi:hypothetical protein